VTPALSESERARFHSKVDQRGPDECWPWMGGRTGDGYGVFHTGGKTHIATRIAVLVAGGEWPGRLHACHRCDNPGCVNPGHLFVATNAGNQRDKAIKGRGAKKLSFETVAEIRRRLETGARQSALAVEFGVSQPCISYIKRRAIWQHVGDAA